MTPRVLASCSLALAACATPAAKTAPPQVASDDAREAAAKGARDMATEIYGAIRRGKADAAQTLLADDAFILGPRAGDVITGRSAAVTALAEDFGITDRHRLRARRRMAVGSPSGRAAWVAEELQIDGASYTALAVLEERDEIWYVTAVHLARLGDPPASSVPPLSGTPPAAADDVIALARRGAGAPASFLDQMPTRPDVIVLGPTKQTQARGYRRIKRLWKRADASGRGFTLRDVHARVTPDDSLAWIAATADVGTDTPHRMFFIYERHPDGWKLVALQDDIPGA